ncbi:enoyl-CoA hydratase/isomerase family protein [Streptomyces sp. NPDC020681]|uniref:enoyl-CoA hydratase/isomerase family protein n=1 Tax=Streptomyces sp. NPDC020681 TaxID=3365083 RepID=UPI0037A1661A
MSAEHVPPNRPHPVESSEDSLVRITQPHPGVVQLALGEPCLSTELLERLAELLTQHQDATAVIITGSGPGFSRGGKPRSVLADTLALARAGARAHDALRAVRGVTLCALHGDCFGAGIALALECDLRISDPATRFRMPELALGISPAWAGTARRMREELGAVRARWLLYTGEPVDARTAYDWGLVQDIAEPGRALDRALELAERLTKAPGRSVTHAKAYVQAQSSGDWRALDAQLLDSSISALHNGLRPG